jgi:hypothetical protein
MGEWGGGGGGGIEGWGSGGKNGVHLSGRTMYMLCA